MIPAKRCDATVLLPVYRANPDYLRLTLDSVIRVAEAQGSTEVILFNDCSPDDSQRIIDDYADRYPSIVRKMRSEHNLGVGNARTEMCRAARGRYILSFDQDDIMLPFDLGGVISMMDQNPQYGASYSKKYLFNSRGLTGEVHGGALSEFNAFFAPKININAMIIRADVLAAHDYFKPVPNSAINDDVFLMIRLGADCEYHFDEDNPRLLYRMHDKQNSRLFHHEDQNPFRWMATYMTEQQPALYKRILANDPPKLTQKNRHWVLGLMGAALFLRQNDTKLVLPISEKACEIAPDDYGAWEHRLLILAIANKYDEFMETFESACERFKGQSPSKELQFILAMGKYYRARRKPLPESVRNRYDELMKAYSTPPQIVRDNLPAQR
ncbi:MAG: glycosyltransferase [Lentisphaeria bacterium]|nr:glycosyltransferase [Lentisphaeria bacterium]